MTLVEIYNLTDEYNKDESLSPEQKFARTQVLKAEAIDIMEDSRISTELQKLAAEREMIPESDEWTNTFRNSNDLDTFYVLSQPNDDLKVDDITRKNIEIRIKHIKLFSQSKVLQVASELEKGLGLKGVINPLNEEYGTDKRGKSVLILNNKDESTLRDDYSKSYQRIQELYTNGTLDLKTKMLAEKQILDIYNRCTKYGYDNLGLDLKVPSNSPFKRER